MEYLSSSYLQLPSKSGVYVFLNDKGSILYVGKAKDLKSRVSSYFANPSLLYGKTKILVPQIKKIKITIVESELEALLLEAFYIKKYKPKYNILMKDGKSYILIRITLKDPFPKVLLARREDDPKSVYFGPFASSTAVKIVLKTIRRIFPYQSVLNHPNKLCLYHHLDLCPCPPVFSNSQEFKNSYRKNIKGIIRMLEGQSKKIMSELEKERDKASKSEKYEEALELQKKINALSIVTTPFHRPFEYDTNPNLRIDIRQKELDELMEVLNNAAATPKVIPAKAGIQKQKDWIPDQVGDDNKKFIKKLERIECYDISNTQGTNATGSMVVLTNGEIDKSQYRKFKIRREWEKNQTNPVISNEVRNPKTKSYEISRKARNDNKNTPNDFAMMKEMLKRRLNHDEWHTPDLIIVDGGKGQVSAVLELTAGLNIPLIGLAKREETIIVPITNRHSGLSRISYRSNQSDSGVALLPRMTELAFTEISLPKNSPALHLIMRIRDEAHRFAITYHKKLRSKATF